jgi:hypothetical protein
VVVILATFGRRSTSVRVGALLDNISCNNTGKANKMESVYLARNLVNSAANVKTSTGLRLNLKLRFSKRKTVNGQLM